MKIHIFPRHLPGSPTAVQHLQAVGLYRKDARACLRGLICKDGRQVKQAWYSSKQQNKEPAGPLALAEAFVEWAD